MTTLDIPALMGPKPAIQSPASDFRIVRAEHSEIGAFRRLRHDAFVDEQGLFTGTDHDDLDDDPRTIVLVALATNDNTVLGGVRIAPATTPDIGWWTGSRLVVAPAARSATGTGTALIRAACALAEQLGVLRFDAVVQERASILFRRTGWKATGRDTIGGLPHLRMRWPIDRYQRLADGSKAHLASVLDGMAPGGARWIGDDGAPVSGTDVIAACDAILPSMVERDPEWAGWCGVLVNVNDLSAMGAAPVALLDAVAGRDASFVTRVMHGLRKAADAWGVQIIGGHTQVGVPAALSVTALGRTDTPVSGGGARAGHRLSITADTTGGWRSGYTGGQWNSTEHRSSAALRDLAGAVGRARPAAAKDVSMAGIVGTIGMLAEASGVGATIDVATVPAPETATIADWLGCFPGFAMVTADEPGASRMSSPYARTAECGAFDSDEGVRLRWPDGETTVAIAGDVTGLGAITHTAAAHGRSAASEAHTERQATA